MTLEAYWNRVVDLIAAALLLRDDMVRLDLYAAETMTNAATPMAARQEFGHLVPRKRHVSSSRVMFGIGAGTHASDPLRSSPTGSQGVGRDQPAAAGML